MSSLRIQAVTSQMAPFVSIKKTNRLMLFSEILVVYCNFHRNMRLKYTPWAEFREALNITAGGTHKILYASVIWTLAG
jgi:hypothetical protein